MLFLIGSKTFFWSLSSIRSGVLPLLITKISVSIPTSLAYSASTLRAATIAYDGNAYSHTECSHLGISHPWMREVQYAEHVSREICDAARGHVSHFTPFRLW